MDYHPVWRLKDVRPFKTKTGVSLSLLQCASSKVFNTPTCTCPFIKIADCPADSSSLDLFDLGNTLLVV